MSKETENAHNIETEALIAGPLLMALVFVAAIGLPIAGVIGAINSEVGSEMALRIVGFFAILGAAYGIGNELIHKK